MIILGTNSIKDTGFDVANSLRFNSGSSDYLTFVPSNATSNQKTWTVSCWVKRSKLGTNQYVWGVNGDTSGHYFTELLFNSSDQLEFRQGGTVGDPYETQYITNRLFRDVSAWSNIVIAADTTDGTEADRLKIWINGVQETSFATTNHPSVNETYRWHFVNGSDYPHSIGRSGRHNTNYFDGYIAEWIDVDGSQLAADSFGEFDEDSGIWKPIDVSGLTLGTNGAYLDFEDSSALGNSSNSNNYTANNLTAIDQTTDTCTNNFALANPLNVNASNVGTFAFGNTTVKVANSSGFSFGSSSTLGMTTGKFYCEAKIITVDATLVGVSANVAEDARDNYPPGVQGGAQSVGILVSSGNKYIDDSGTTHGAALSADDILMIALDLDNNNVYFGKDGNWFDGSGNADESSPNSAIAVTAVGSTAEGAYFFSFGDGGGSAKGKVSWNFGNASHAISSGNTDGDGFGNFEFAVPSGYFALCTKNLAEYG